VEEIEAVVDDADHNLGIAPGYLPRFTDLKFLEQRVLSGIGYRLRGHWVCSPETPRERGQAADT
jgi:hypothetical protein